MLTTDLAWTEDEPLPGAACDLLVDAIRPVPLDSARHARVRSGLLERVRAQGAVSPPSAVASPQFITAHAQDCAWHPLVEGVDIKILDETPPYRSCYLRFAAGASLPAHPHRGEELCVVIEGTVQLGDIFAQAGDLHVALPGSFHREIRSETGCILFIRAPLEQARHHI